MSATHTKPSPSAQASGRALRADLLVTVDDARLRRAVHAFVSRTYEATILRATEEDLRGVVSSGEGHVYAVTIQGTTAACSCSDAMYRGVTCKHAIMLLLAESASAPFQPEQVH